MKINNPSKDFDLVYVLWTDAYARNGWLDKAEYKQVFHPTEMIIHQVGWLVESCKTHITLASMYNPASDKYGDFQMIPKTWCRITILSRRANES